MAKGLIDGEGLQGLREVAIYQQVWGCVGDLRTHVLPCASVGTLLGGISGWVSSLGDTVHQPGFGGWSSYEPGLGVRWRVGSLVLLISDVGLSFHLSNGGVRDPVDE